MTVGQSMEIAKVWIMLLSTVQREGQADPLLQYYSTSCNYMESRVCWGQLEITVAPCTNRDFCVYDISALPLSYLSLTLFYSFRTAHESLTCFRNRPSSLWAANDLHEGVFALSICHQSCRFSPVPPLHSSSLNISSDAVASVVILG